MHGENPVPSCMLCQLAEAVRRSSAPNAHHTAGRAAIGIWDTHSKAKRCQLQTNDYRRVRLSPNKKCISACGRFRTCLLRGTRKTHCSSPSPYLAVRVSAKTLLQIFDKPLLKNLDELELCFDAATE